MASTKTIWARLRRATGFPRVMLASLAGVGFERYDSIEDGRTQPTPAERDALMGVLVGPGEPQPVCSPLDVALSENVSSVAKRQNLVLTPEQVRALATVIANVVTERLARVFPEEPAGAEPEGEVR
jgi:hypothetical protein